jgi:hypothetical protein
VLTYFPFSEKRRLDLVAEDFNLLNHGNILAINQAFGSGLAPLPYFGSPIAFGSARKLRFSIDFEF